MPENNDTILIDGNHCGLESPLSAPRVNNDVTTVAQVGQDMLC